MGLKVHFLLPPPLSRWPAFPTLSAPERTQQPGPLAFGLMDGSSAEHCTSHFYFHILFNPLLSGLGKRVLWAKVAPRTTLGGFSEIPKSSMQSWWKFQIHLHPRSGNLKCHLTFSGTSPTSGFKAAPSSFSLPPSCRFPLFLTVFIVSNRL